jgi:hypothetical protein
MSHTNTQLPYTITCLNHSCLMISFLTVGCYLNLTSWLTVSASVSQPGFLLNVPPFFVPTFTILYGKIKEILAVIHKKEVLSLSFFM